MFGDKCVPVSANLQAQIRDFKINYCILSLKTTILHKLLNIIYQNECIYQIILKRATEGISSYLFIFFKIIVKK